MPRDLFGDVVDPSIRVGTRRWYTVPVSFAIHTLVLAVLVVVPLLATGTLPLPIDPTVFIALTPPELPKPPAVRSAPPQSAPAGNHNVAPAVEPDAIGDEPALDRSFDPTEAVDVLTGGEISGPAVIAPPPAPPAVAEPPKPVRPGGDVRPPERITYVAPAYPPVALAARVQGLVIIEATIDANGQVQAARVLRSDSPILNGAALSAVRQWVYRPTLLNGVPVSIIMTVTVQFRLQ